MDRLSTNANDPESLRKELMRSFANFESSFRRRFPVIWTLTLLTPVVLSALILVGLGLAYGWKFPRDILGHAFLTFFVLGRFIVLMGLEGDVREGIQISMAPGQLFAMVTYMDFMTAMFVTFHMGFLFRMPYVGPKVATLVWDGKFIMDAHPWIKRVAFLGLVIFVIFPTSTTGSIGGSIFGRLLGLSRFLTLMGILLGSLIGNALMYAFSKQLNDYLSPDNWWLKIAGIALIVILMALMELRYRHVKKKYLVNELGVDEDGQDSN
jgi:hypothetical protein